MKRFAKVTTNNFTPLFEWAVDADGHDILEEGRTDYGDAFNIINEKCLDWLNIEGHLIIHYSFGFEKVLIESTRYYPAEFLKFKWKANNYTSIFGTVLNGLDVSGYSFLFDFCKVLDVDQFYTIGLIHGVDGLSKLFIRKQIQLNDSYKTGYKHGEELANKYVVIKGGYMAKGK